MTPPPPSATALSDTQKIFVLLAEIRQCINDDHLMAAQRKVMAIEAALHAAPVETAQEKDAFGLPKQEPTREWYEKRCRWYQEEVERLSSPVVPGLREQLTHFVERERALRDAVGKGGQTVGYSPSISPSTLKELERMLRDTLPSPAAHTEDAV